MKLKQKGIIGITLAFAVMTLAAVIPQPTVQAYSCATNADGSPAKTSGGASYYYNSDPNSPNYGRCMEPYYESVTSKGSDGKVTTKLVRDPSKDKPAGPVPTYDNGQQIPASNLACYSDSTGKVDPNAHYDANFQGGKCVQNKQCTTSGGRSTTTSACAATGDHRGPKDANDPTNAAAQCSQQTDQAAKEKCSESQLCPSASNDSQISIDTGLTSCQQGVKDCIDSGKTGTDLQQCLDAVNGVDPTKAAAVAGVTPGGGGGPNANNGNGTCGGVQTAIISCPSDTGSVAIGNVLKWALRILTAGVGIVGVGGIAYGAILYAGARDNVSQTQQAITIIRNVVIGLMLFVFMAALINWLVPGSIIG